METHLYTLCWNEADMLEFFFRHYDPWIDRYIIFDDGSTDGSIEILKSHPKVELRKWQRKFPDSYLHSQIYWLDEAWKESRRRSDWVVIVDIDEHIFVPQTPMMKVLERYNADGITMVPTLGFNMRSLEFPETGEHLIHTRTVGKPFDWMCKLSIINPDAIEETNFTSGRHFSSTVGNLKIPSRDEVLLLHYKYLGFERTLKKQSSHYNNLGVYDNALGSELRLVSSRKEMLSYWEKALKESSDMYWPDYDPDTYPNSYRWWRPFKYLLALSGKIFFRPIHVIYFIKEFFSRRSNPNPSNNFIKFMEEINNSSVRKEMYNLIVKGGKDGNNQNTVTAVNNKDEIGVLVHCLHSSKIKELADIKNYQFINDAKCISEEKYQKKFDVYFITNSKGFTKRAIWYAKRNNIKLFSRKNFMSFLASVNIS